MTDDKVGEDEGTCLGSMAAEAPEQWPGTIYPLQQLQVLSHDF